MIAKVMTAGGNRPSPPRNAVPTYAQIESSKKNGRGKKARRVRRQTSASNAWDDHIYDLSAEIPPSAMEPLDGPNGLKNLFSKVQKTTSTGSSAAYEIASDVISVTTDLQELDRYVFSFNYVFVLTNPKLLVRASF